MTTGTATRYYSELNSVKHEQAATGTRYTRPIWKYPHTEPTRRGWLFLGRHGGPCDKACAFCYYTYQTNLVFYGLDTLLAHANKFRHFYGLEFCDISGGEATIYGAAKEGRRPDLETLVRHCASIGLKPTIITHGQNNTPELVKGIEDAGLEDWLISLHGMAEGHNRAVVNHKGEGSGGWQRLVGNLPHVTRPVRFNTTLQNFNYLELPALARWLVDNRPATVWNLIQFNPFFKWSDRPDIDFQTKASDLAPHVGEAVAIAEAAGWEVNVRYFPFCIAAPYGFAKNCINFYQTQYDPWEWNIVATEHIPMDWVREQGGMEKACRAYIDAAIAKSRANEKCNGCALRAICEGPTTQYQERYGIDELVPFTGAPVTDVPHLETNALDYA